jgi:hypothetical protein
MATLFDEYSGGSGPQYNVNAQVAQRTPSTALTLEKILSDYFKPEFNKLQGQQGDLQKMFMDKLAAGPDFAKFRGELSTVATGVADELFSPGGEVDKAYQGAFGQTVESGFGTSSGGFERARHNILGGARDVVSRGIAQGALQLAGTASQANSADLATLLGFQQGEAGRLEGLRESMFGGQATIESLGLAKRTADLNERMINQSLQKQSGGGGFWGGLKKFAGQAIGGIAGAALGPVGAMAGAKLGGAIFGQPSGGTAPSPFGNQPAGYNPYFF